MDENSVVLSGRLESVKQMPMKDPGRECATIMLSISDDGKVERLLLTLWGDLARQASAISEGSHVTITGRLKYSRWQQGAAVAVTGVQQLP